MGYFILIAQSRFSWNRFFMNLSRSLGILILTGSILATARAGDDQAAVYSPTDEQPVQIVRSLPGQVVQALPGQIVQALPGQVVPPLPGQATPPLSGQVVPALSGQIVPPLAGQLVQSLPLQTTQALPGKIVHTAHARGGSHSGH
jgi:hypothetical protein